MSRSDSEHGSLVMNHNTDVDLFDGITEDDLPADDVGWGTTISAAWTQADAGQYREFVSILLEQVRKLTDQLDRARETIRFQRDERGSIRTETKGQS